MDAKHAHDLPHRLDLSEQRKALHGKRRQLHERLAKVCEGFVLGDMTRAQKQRALVSELRYLLAYYEDDGNWEGVE
jgi:hypothetical protein